MSCNLLYTYIDIRYHFNGSMLYWYRDILTYSLAAVCSNGIEIYSRIHFSGSMLYWYRDINTVFTLAVVCTTGIEI